MTGRAGAQPRGPSGPLHWGLRLHGAIPASPGCPPWCSPPLLALSFVPCSEKIHLAVTEMASLFPKVGGVGGPRGGEGSPPGPVSSPQRGS